MTVHFITRTYSKSPGGMQRVSRALKANLPVKVFLTALRLNARWHIVWFAPYAFLKALLSSGRYDLIHLGDASLAPLGFWLKLLTRKKVLVTVHGLDITYGNFLYQFNIHALLVSQR